MDIKRYIKIGNGGNEYIYVYYYPSYKELAFYNDVTLFPCKIGRTDKNPISRVTQQLNSCAPEEPIIALVFECENSRLFEKVIHQYMELHQRHIEHSFNKEWFNTNPDEIYAVVKNVLESPDELLFK